MPDLANYLQRVSFALRQGKPANDVALLLPNDDVWSTFAVRSDSTKPVISGSGFNTEGSNFSMDESMGNAVVNTAIQQVLDSGLNVDFIDADAIDAVGIPYAALILPGVDRLPVKTYEKIEEYAQHGGVVIAAHGLPSTAPGFLDAESDGKKIREISQRLFSASDAAGHFVPDENNWGPRLRRRSLQMWSFLPRRRESGSSIESWLAEICTSLRIPAIKRSAYRRHFAMLQNSRNGGIRLRARCLG